MPAKKFTPVFKTNNKTLVMTKDIIFTLPAEAVAEATEGLLLGDFNNWNESEGIKLKKQKDGSLKAVVQLEAGKTYQYRYLLNDGRWENDYHAQNYVPVSGLHIDNCLITVSETLDIEQKPEAEAIVKAKTEKAEPIKAKSVKAEPVKAESVKVKATKAKTEKVKTEKTKTAPKAEKKEAKKK